MTGVQVSMYVDGVGPRGSGDDSVVRIGHRISLEATFSRSSSCSQGVETVTVSANLEKFGASADSRLTKAENNIYRVNFTVNASAANGLNNLTTNITVNTKWQCTLHLLEGAIAEANGYSVDFPLDNVPPTAILTILNPAPGDNLRGVGKTFEYMISNPSTDIANSTVNLSEFTGSVGHNGWLNLSLDDGDASAVPADRTGANAVTIEERGVDNPRIFFSLRDKSGNQQTLLYNPNGVTFDAATPAMTAASITPYFGNSMRLNVTPLPADVDPDAVEYEVVWEYAANGTDLPTFKCNRDAKKDNCEYVATKGTPGEKGEFNITRPLIISNVTYNFIVTPVDNVGNRGPSITLPNVRANATLRGYVEISIADGSPKQGGIGTVLNVTYRDWGAGVRPHNVSLVRLNASGIGTAEWGNETGNETLYQNVTLTVRDGDAPWTPTATLVGYRGTMGAAVKGWDNGTVPVIDPKRPGAASNAVARANPNGSVEIDFTPPTDADLNRYEVRFKPIGETTMRVKDFGARDDDTPHPPPFIIPAEELTSGATHEFHIVAFDGFGNEGHVFPPLGDTSLQTRPTQLPVVVSVTPQIPSQDLPSTFSGTWSSVDSLDPASSSLNFTLRAPDGKYWNAQTQGFQDAYYTVPFAAPSGTSGTWSITNVTTSATAPAGNYTLNVTLRNDLTGAEHSGQDLAGNLPKHYVDRHVPEFRVGGTFKNTTIVSDVAKGVQQGVTRIDVNLNVTDAGGISTDGYEIFYTLVNPTTKLNATSASGQQLTLRCPAQCALTPALSNGQVQYDGATSLFFTNVPLGTYALNVTVYDRANNARSHTYGDTFTVAPRVAIAQSPLTPSVTTDGRVDVYGQAAFEAAQSHDPSGTCPSNVCRVTKVEYYAREGATGDGTLISTVTIPIAGPGDFLGTGVQYYNYTPSSRPTLSGDLNNTYVRAKATVQLSPTVQFTQFSGWARVRTLDAPAGLVFTNPLLENSVYQGTNAGDLFFNASYEHTGLDQAPKLNYTVLRLNADGTQTPVLINSTAATASWHNISHTTLSGARYFYNFSNNEPVDEGDYLLKAHLWTDYGTQMFERRFSVASTSPTLSFPAPQPDVHDGSYVGREFNISLKVAHGYANVTTGSFSIWMVNGTGALVSPLSYSAILKPIDHVSRQESVVTWKVTLPQAAANGERFDFRANVSTTAYQTCQCSLANNSLSKPLVLDTVPAAAGTFLDASRNSGTSLSSPLAIKGFAEDAGTGIARVEARIVNLSAGKTWHPTHATFVNGEGEHWFKNSSNGFQLSVAPRQPSAVDRASWTIDPAALGMQLDRGSTYRIDVRAVDKIGLFALANSTTLTFDPLAPNVTAPHASPTGGVVDWHGSGVFRAYAEDNHCLKRVSLMGLSPSNVTVGPADFTSSGYACSPTTGNEPGVEWTIDLANHPFMTDEVGDYLYWVEAEDASGLVANTSIGGNVTITVRDNTPAEVRFLHLEPSTAPVGGTSMVVAEIFENDAVDRVEAVVLRVSDNVEVGNGTLKPVNVSATGSGRWSADLALDLNASLELGDYVVRVRAIDNVTAQFHAEQGFCSPACDYMNVILRVTADAPPAVLQSIPASGTEFVNATPTFQFRVLHPDISQSGITLTAGTDNLSAVTPSFEAIRTSNGSLQGYKVSYSVSDALADGENFTVRVVAVSNKAGLTNTSTFTFQVDGTPPTVAHNLTGAQELNGKTYALSGTRVTLEAEENLTGPATITYRINDGATPQQYTGPITPGGSDGTWTLHYVATDGAGNAATGTLTLHIDRTGPAISVAKHGDELLLTVTDAGVGVDQENVTVHYAYGASAAFTALKMEHVTGNSFEATLPGNATETGLRYWFQAKDVLGNTNSLHSAGSPHEIEKDQPTVQNLAPTVRITAPGNGASVRGLLSLTWIAEDPEDAPLTVTISLRGPDGNQVLQPSGENTGHYTIDTKGFAAGAYTLVLTVTDGVNSPSVETTFTVEAGKSIEAVQTPPSSVAANSAVNVLVRIHDGGKGIANATYRLLRDGAVVKTGPLVSAQGMWGAQFVPDQPGKYQVFVSVQYEDGTSEPASQVAAFEVQGEQVTQGPEGAFPASLVILLAVGVLTIALAAYGGFMRWKQ